MTAERPATLYDVALLARVSHQTVSRVVNDAHGVSDETRERVRSAVRELGYRPNPVAKELASGRSKRIGVLAHQMYATGPSAIFKAAFGVLQDAGYQLDVAYYDEPSDPADIRECLARFDRSTSGVLAMPQTAAVRDAIVGFGLSVPYFTDEMLDRGTPAHPGTEELIGRAAVAHLVELGHRRIGHLEGPTGSLAADFRVESVAEALVERGLPPLSIGHGDWSLASGYAVGQRFDPTMCTAVFVSNDEMAIGFLRALRERGIRVPDEVSVLGADDLAEDDFVEPALSSIAHDFEGEGGFAALTLIADVEHLPRPVAEDYIRVRVRARSSTARPPLGE